MSDTLGKTCSKCATWKALDEFRRHSVARDGRQSWCRMCSNEGKRLGASSRVCPDCGAEFRRRGRGARCTPCGHAHAAAVYRAKHKPRVKAYPKVTRTRLVMRLHRKHKPRAFVAGTCPTCGDNFVAFAWTASRYCSEVCGKRADRHAHQHRRRARRKGGERIFRRKVFVRDAWTCRLCGKPIDREAVVPHPLAATVDHILPLALGGAHVYANVQTAHFLCNSKKADNVTQLSFAA